MFGDDTPKIETELAPNDKMASVASRYATLGLISVPSRKHRLLSNMSSPTFWQRGLLWDGRHQAVD